MGKERMDTVVYIDSVDGSVIRVEVNGDSVPFTVIDEEVE